MFFCLVSALLFFGVWILFLYVFCSVFGLFLVCFFTLSNPLKRLSEKGLQKRGENRAKRPQAKRLRLKKQIVDNFFRKGELGWGKG